MQNAKDTFYVMLRDRLAALNPGRTGLLRGLTRPGVFVEENELTTAYEPADVFCLRWTGLTVNTEGALPLATMQCEVRYRTDGNAGNGGMDRGRLLAGMDAELAAAAGETPHHTVKMNYAGVSAGAPAVAMGTSVFWGDVTFAPVVVNAERLERVATIPVYAYQEAGEL
jgi:hypothetical protein